MRCVAALLHPQPMMIRSNRALMLGFLFAGGAACSTRGGPIASSSVAPATAQRAGTRPGTEADGAVNVGEATRLLVRRAAIDVVVEDVARAAARAQSILVSSNGYVEREQRAERSVAFTLRVPEASLNAVLDSLATLGRVASRTVSAEDVTEQAIDLDARLKALLVTRDRLRQLHEKASSVSDVITVERELARVQGEVDSLEGRLKHLRSSAALAEVQVSIRQKVVLGPLGIVAQALGTVITKLFVWR